MENSLVIRRAGEKNFGGANDLEETVELWSLM